MKENKTSITSQNRIAVGIILAAHGIKGQVKIRSYTAIPDDMFEYGPLYDKEGRIRFDATFDGITKNALIVSFKHIKDRNDAEVLRGTELYADGTNISSTEEEFLYKDLIGLEIRDRKDSVLGVVTALYDFGAGDILEMRLTATGKKEMFAFTQQNFPEIHLKASYILADLPEIIEVKKTRENE